MWEEVEAELEPGVAWYRVEPELELVLSSELDELVVPDDPVEPDDPAATLLVTAMTDPSPKKATTLDAAAILRARLAGCRRRRRRSGAARSADTASPLDARWRRV